MYQPCGLSLFKKGSSTLRYVSIDCDFTTWEDQDFKADLDYLHSEFEASLGYTRFCVKNKQDKTKQNYPNESEQGKTDIQADRQTGHSYISASITSLELHVS